MVIIIFIAVAMVYDYGYTHKDIVENKNCTCYELQMKKLSDNMYQNCIKKDCK